MSEFSASDVVPRFRTDLTVSGSGQGAGENRVSVKDPDNGKMLTMRGFELSIARMLNGSRTAGELVEKAKAIGLPISLAGLSRFVAQLRANGFVTEGGEPTDGTSTTWPQRKEWPKEQREQFQVALREARTNQLTEAKHHLEEMKQDAFDSTDVKELDAWVNEHLKETDDGKKLPSFPEIFNSVEQSWFDEGDKDSEANAAKQAAVVTLPHAEPDDHADAPPRRRGRVIGALALVVLAVAIVLVAVIQWPTHAPGTFEVQPQASATVTADQPGVVGRIEVSEGQWVGAGEELFRYDTDTPKQKMAELDQAAAKVQQQLDQLAQAVAVPAQALTDAQAELAKDQAELAEAQAANRRHDTARAQRHITDAQKKVDAATAALAKAQGEAETAARVTRDALNGQLASIAAEHDAQKALSELPPLKASAAGVVTGLAIKAGDTIKHGAAVCRLDDTRKLAVVVHADDPRVLHAPESASAEIDGRRIDILIDKVENGVGHGVVDNPDRRIKPGTHGDLSITVERRSLLARWL